MGLWVTGKISSLLLRISKCVSTLLAFLYIYPFLFGFLCSLLWDILSVVGSGVPKICNAYEENVTKQTLNTELSQNLTTKRCLNIKTNPYWNIYWDWSQNKGIANQNSIWAPYVLKRSIGAWYRNHQHNNGSLP
jgi:hypothetical protein